jgi:hypothetical protein
MDGAGGPDGVFRVIFLALGIVVSQRIQADQDSS